MILLIKILSSSSAFCLAISVLLSITSLAGEVHYINEKEYNKDLLNNEYKSLKSYDEMSQDFSDEACQAYLDILYEKHIAEDAGDPVMPGMILQPLVENAVSHGIARKKDGGTVWIGGAREGDKVVFTVEDNGAGMDEFAQEELRQILARPDAKSGSIGLKNVYERIRLYYGERAKLTWDSREGEYTRFCLMIEPEGGSVCGF